MDNISRQSILAKYPWAKEKTLFDKIDSEEDFGKEIIVWDLNECQLFLLEKLLGEIEYWFKSHDKKIDIEIYYIGELLDSLHIDFSSSTREVFLIIDKYKQFSLDLLDEVDEEVDDYEDVF